jgi:dolichyl-phosphate beta-glucosyltransferase
MSRKKVNKISVIIPAFNEDFRLIVTLEEIKSYCLKGKFGKNIGEVVVVDDGSNDMTVSRALKFSKNFSLLRVVRQSVNTGKWGALRKGIYSAKYDDVLLLDADGSASIKELDKVDLNNFFDNDVVVFGCRFLEDSSVEGKSFFRQIISIGYLYCVNLLYLFAVGFRKSVFYGCDMQCPFKLFNRNNIKYKLNVNRWAGDIELACSMSRKGVKCVNTPINFIHMGGSKVKKSTMFSMLFDTLRVSLRYRLYSKRYRL